MKIGIQTDTEVDAQLRENRRLLLQSTGWKFALFGLGMAILVGIILVIISVALP